MCTYTTNNGSEQTPPDLLASPSKRRNIEELPAANPGAPDATLASESPAAATTPWELKPQPPVNEEKPTVGFDIKPSIEQDQNLPVVDREVDLRSRHSTASGPDEETSLIQSTRMLQDPTGRLRMFLPLSPALLRLADRTLSLRGRLGVIGLSSTHTNDRRGERWAQRLHTGPEPPQDHGGHHSHAGKHTTPAHPARQGHSERPA